MKIKKRGGDVKSKKKHREPPFVIPEYLQARSFDCDFCGTKNLVNWYRKQDYPKESIAAQNQSGHWVPVSFLNDCSHCHAVKQINVETKDLKAGIVVGGDEAEREFNDKYYYLISGCIISPEVRLRIENKVFDLEAKLRKESGGSIDIFHAKEIMDSRVWPGGTLAQRQKYLRKMCKIISTNRITKFNAAGCLVSASGNQRKYLRDQVFSAFYIFTLEKFTWRGWSPLYKFDQVQRGKRNGWAEECVVGLRHYPIFVELARGLHIPEPEFVEPLSSLESKISDCLAYVTAREFHCKIRGREDYVPSNQYGSAWHSGYNGRGDLIYRHAKGFPLKEVFGF